MENIGSLVLILNLLKHGIRINMALFIVSGGSKGAMSPYGPNFLNFMQFFGNFGKMQNLRLAPPPTGNPGSAPDSYSDMCG